MSFVRSPAARVSRRGALSAAVSLAFAATPSSTFAADAAPPDPAAMPETQRVAVTAMRMPVRVADTVADVTVITRDDLDHATGRTLSEILAAQEGIQASSNGGLGKSSSVFVRGLEARHVLLLVDGVRLGSATLGLSSFDNLPVGLVDHIEIVRGPLSSLYGADAAAGVIQVFTRRARAGVESHAQLSAGSLGFLAGEGGVGFGAGGVDAAVDLQRVQNRGFSATNAKVPFGSYDPDRDGFEQDSGSARLGWQASPDWRLEALALQSSGETKYDDGVAAGAQARAMLRNGVQSLTLAGKPMPGWHTRVQLSRSSDEYDTLESTSPYASLGTVRTVEKALSWEVTADTPVGTVLGLLEKRVQDVTKPGDAYDATTRNLYGAALALNGAAHDVTWQASLRRDHNSQYGNETTGGAALGYAITPWWRLGASYGTSFVAPSFNQLYYPGYGNPLLQPEQGHSTEVNARWADAEQELKLVAYWQRIRGYITSGAQAVNVPQVQADGTTLSWERRFDAGSVRLSWDHVDPRDETHDTPLPRRAKNSVKADGQWQQGAFAFGGTVGAYSSRPDTTYDDNFNAVPVTLGAYATLDLRADWTFAPAWSLGLRVNNVAGKQYETSYGYNEPRREAFVVLAWHGR